MRAREFITEYKQDITARQYGRGILQHALSGPDSGEFSNPDDTQSVLNTVFSYLEHGDPTYNAQTKQGGIYIPWIAREYSRGNIQRLEDIIGRVRTALGDYHQNKRRGDFPSEAKDIMRIDWNGLQGVVEKYVPKDNQVDRGEYKEIYRDSDVRVIQPLDTTAACYYGQGTRWCTAGRNNNFFNQYNRQGPLYIILPQNPEHPGEKYQFHFESDQYMDEYDHEVSLAQLLQKIPGIINLPGFTEIDHFSYIVTGLSEAQLKYLLSHYPNISSKIIEVFSDSVADQIDDKKYTVLNDKDELEDESDLSYLYGLINDSVDKEPDIVKNADFYVSVYQSANSIFWRYYIDPRKIIPKHLLTSDVWHNLVRIEKTNLTTMPSSLMSIEMLVDKVKINGPQGIPDDTRTHPAIKKATNEYWMKRVREDSSEFTSVPYHLRTKQLSIMAVKKDDSLLSFVPDDVKTYDFYKQVGYKLSIDQIPDKYKTDEFLIISNLQHDIPNKKWENEDFCIKAFNLNKSSLLWIPHRFERLHTEQNWLNALKQNTWMVETYNLDEIPEQIIKIPSINTFIFKQAYKEKNPYSAARNLIKIITTVIKDDPTYIKFIPDELKTKQFYSDVFDKGTYFDKMRIFMNIPEEFKTLELCLAAVKQNENALRYVPDQYKEKIKQQLNLS